MGFSLKKLAKKAGNRVMDEGKRQATREARDVGKTLAQPYVEEAGAIKKTAQVKLKEKKAMALAAQVARNRERIAQVKGQSSKIQDRIRAT